MNFNCHGYKINAILQFEKKIYLKLLAVTECTIFHSWPLSCPSITVFKKSFDGNKRPGSAYNESEGKAAELFKEPEIVCVLSSDRDIL